MDDDDIRGCNEADACRVFFWASSKRLVFENLATYVVFFVPEIYVCIFLIVTFDMFQKLVVFVICMCCWLGDVMVCLLSFAVVMGLMVCNMDVQIGVRIV